MKKKILLLGISATFLSPLSLATEQFQVFTHFDSEIYTEAQPIQAFVDDFDAPLSSGDSAFTYNTFELGVGYGDFKIGLQSRFDYVLNFDPDTARYTHTEKNDLAFEERFYTYYLDAKQVTSNGLFVSYDFKFLADKNVQITPKIAVFSSTHFQDGIVDGQIFSDDIEGDLQVDYYFSKDSLFKRYTPSENPQGLGYSLDLATLWQVNKDLQLGLTIKDLLYHTDYDDSGFVKGHAVDTPYSLSADNTVISQPTIALSTSANNRTQTHKFKMKKRIFAHADYRINDLLSTAVSVRQYDKDTFTKMTARLHFWQHWRVQAGYETKSEALHLGIENDYFGFNIQTDNIDFEKAYYANLHWYINIKF